VKALFVFWVAALSFGSPSAGRGTPAPSGSKAPRAGDASTGEVSTGAASTGEADLHERISGVEARPRDWDDALVAVPRILLWPLRAGLWLISKPALLFTSWAERSGLADFVSGILESPEGYFRPFVRWRSYRRITAGMDVETRAVFPSMEDSVLRAKAWGGGGGVWGGGVQLILPIGSAMRAAIGANASERDDSWVRLSDGRGVGFETVRARAGVRLRWRFSPYFAVDAGGGVEHEAWSVPAETRIVEDVSSIDEPPVPELGWGPEEMSVVKASLGMLFAPWQRPSWRGSLMAHRRRLGPGGLLVGEVVESVGASSVRFLSAEAEAWWTWRVARQTGLLTVWLAFWYLKSMGSAPVPPPLSFRLGGTRWLRGLRRGDETGSAAGLVSVEYSYAVSTDLWLTPFWDWGQATDSRFSTWRWDIGKSSLGGRLEWIPFKRWSVYVQAAVSERGWVTGVGLGRLP
jgi:hypothetical protein